MSSIENQLFTLYDLKMTFNDIEKLTYIPNVTPYDYLSILEKYTFLGLLLFFYL